MEIKTLILNLLKKGELSTYEIAKVLKISWSTANVHLYMLKSENKIKKRESLKKIGSGKTIYWSLIVP